jgi:hypothetical protein
MYITLQRKYGSVKCLCILSTNACRSDNGLCGWKVQCAIQRCYQIRDMKSLERYEGCDSVKSVVLSDGVFGEGCDASSQL